MQRPIERARLLFVAAALLFIITIAGSAFALGQVGAQDDTPVGEWAVALGRTDVPVDVASSFSYVGRWRLGIAADGTYEAERMDVGSVVVSGTWSTDGDQITFTDEDGILSCSNAAAAPIIDSDLTSGTYTWIRSGKTLTLTRVDDACPGRSFLLSTSRSRRSSPARLHHQHGPVARYPVASPVRCSRCRSFPRDRFRCRYRQPEPPGSISHRVR